MIFLYSITKKQQEQQHFYDRIPIKPLSPFSNDNNIGSDPAYGDLTNNTIKTDEDRDLESSNDDNIANDPAYSVCTNITIKTDEDTDLEYIVEDTQTWQVKTDDIEIFKNPAYAETKFN